MRISVLEGSLRSGSLSRVFARNVKNLAPDECTVAILPSTGNLPHFNQDVLDQGLPDPVSGFSGALGETDALLIVTPEYNWSFPGALKNAIDWVSRLKPNPLANMPVAIWTISPGLLGGARAHEGLRHVLHSQDMRIMAKPEVQISGARGKIDLDSDSITDEATTDFLRQHLKSFHQFCNSWKYQP